MTQWCGGEGGNQGGIFEMSGPEKDSGIPGRGGGGCRR
jgi:hypothetical protein